MDLMEGEESNPSETDVEPGAGDRQRLVSVAESIRYRKRAQNAEKEAATLAQELAKVKLQSLELAKELKNIQIDQVLTRKLAGAGVVDLEAAVLVAKNRLEAEPGAEIDGVIESLKREKEYLFAGKHAGGSTAVKTAAAKDKMTSRQSILERAAKRATTTGNRTDLQEYLRVRRNFV